MKEALIKSIEGGYDKIAVEDIYSEKLSNAEIGGLELAIREDPLFWQALGKAMGWKEFYRQPTPKQEERSNQKVFMRRFPRWKKEWHRFIDHLIKGKDAESFFKELLK